MEGTCGEMTGPRCQLHHRTANSIRKFARRTGNLLSQRSQRQCARVQSVCRRSHDFREMNKRPSASTALYLGLAAFALILGALGFQYLGHLPPCEMCMWQRYPHIAAGIVGVGGFLLLRASVLPGSAASGIAIVTALLILLSGAIGVYHAGVEWHFWPGPQSCTGSAFHASGSLVLNAPVVMGDHAAWRLFGLSLAGYNAILSLALAAVGFTLATRNGRSP